MVVASPAAPPLGSWQPGLGTPAVVHVASWWRSTRAAPCRRGPAGLRQPGKDYPARSAVSSADQPVRGMNRASPDWGKRRQTAMGLWLAAALTVPGVAAA